MGSNDPKLKLCSETLSTMLDYLGLEAEHEATYERDCIVLNIRSEDPGRIIGRKGQTIDAVQLLINKMLRRDQENFPLIIIDVDGYKKNIKSKRGNRRPGRPGRKDDNREKEQDVSAEATENAPAPKKEKPKADSAPAPKKQVNKDQAPAPKAPKPEAPKSETAPETTEAPKAPKPEAPKAENPAPKAEKPAPKQDQTEPTPANEAGERRSNLSPEREDTVRRQALDAAKEVKRWGDEVKLPPLNASERRIVHLTLENDPDIMTESAQTGSQGRKRVIVRASK